MRDRLTKLRNNLDIWLEKQEYRRNLKQKGRRIITLSFFPLPILVIWQVLAFGIAVDFTYQFFPILLFVFVMEIGFPIILLFSITEGERPMKLWVPYTQDTWEIITQYYKDREYTYLVTETESSIGFGVTYFMTENLITIDKSGDRILLTVPSTLQENLSRFIAEYDVMLEAIEISESEDEE